MHYLTQQNYFQINGFAQENPLPQFKVASYKFLGIRLSFEDPTTLLPRGGGGGEGRIGRLRSLDKKAPQVCNFLYSFVQETFLFFFVSWVEPQPFVPVHPGLASIFNITTALHAEFLTAFVQFSGHFFLICTKSIQPLRPRKFRTCCDFQWSQIPKYAVVGQEIRQ